LEAAREALINLKKLEPDFTVGAFKNRFPGRDIVPDYVDFLGAALLRAGLPA
jgi:hypothetical protein